MKNDQTAAEATCSRCRHYRPFSWLVSSVDGFCTDSPRVSKGGRIFVRDASAETCGSFAPADGTDEGALAGDGGDGR